MRSLSLSTYRPGPGRAITQADTGAADQSGGMGGMMQDLAFAIPGVDEAMGFAEIMKSVVVPPAALVLPATIQDN